MKFYAGKRQSTGLERGYNIGEVLLMGNVELFADAGSGYFNAFNGLPRKGRYLPGIHIESDKGTQPPLGRS